MSPTRLALQALGQSPAGSPAEKEACCSACAQRIQIGDLCSPYEPGASFTDEVALVGRDQQLMLCGFCVPFFTKALMIPTQAAIFSAAGAFSIFSRDQRLSVLLAPPKPPYVIVLKTANLQHMLWRARVTHDSDLMFVRHGTRALTIHRPTVLAARDRLLKYKLPPFRLDSLGVNPTAWTWIAEDVSAADRAFFQSMSSGSLWALALIHGSTVEPRDPTRIEIKS